MIRAWKAVIGWRVHVSRLSAICVLGIAAAAAPAASAQVNLNTTTATLLAKAQADECYIALGENVPLNFPPCAEGQTPKVNQSYVWSAVDTGDDVWFGTVANALCTTQGAFSSNSAGTTPYQTPSWACEYAASPYSPFPLPGYLGDFRPPKIYVYNKASGALTDMTPSRTTATGTDRNDELLRSTSGIRAGALVGDYVIFSGPKLSGGLAFFAFNWHTKQWIAKGELQGYSNIRKFLTVEGVTYAGVGGLVNGGSVLRFKGSFANLPTPAPGDGAPQCNSCFSFDTVGRLDSDAAYLTMHNGRMFVSTWPKDSGLGGIVMGPPLPAGGYTRSNIDQWTKVWDATQYEPDPTIATSYAGGALMSFGGYLYFGTINVPYASLQAWVAVYGPPANEDEFKQLFTYTFRPAVMFRAQGFETGAPTVDLLYGAPKLFAYTPPAEPGGTGTWALTTNKMPAGKTNPLYGTSGINNSLNVYIWEMALWQNKLWVGTFDWSWVVDQSQDRITLPTAKALQPAAAATVYGADLVFFNDTTSAAVTESNAGLINPTSYGVRTMIPAGDVMYVGMANAANLLGDTTDDQPDGGWELIKLQPKTTAAKGK